MYMKIAIFVAALGIMGAGAWWAKTMIEENTALTLERNDALAANADILEDNNYLLNEIRTRDADILARDNFINELKVTTSGIRKELADAKKNISIEELACLESDIPVAYRQQLLQRSSQDRNEDGTRVPVISVSTAVPVQ